MGLRRSTYYDEAGIDADDAEIVTRMRAICDEFETYGTVAWERRFAKRGSSSMGRTRARAQSPAS